MRVRPYYREIRLTYEEMRFLADLLKYYDYQARVRDQMIYRRQIRLRDLEKATKLTDHTVIHRKYWMEKAILEKELEDLKQHDGIDIAVVRTLERRFRGLVKGLRPRSSHLTKDWLQPTHE